MIKRDPSMIWYDPFYSIANLFSVSHNSFRYFRTFTRTFQRAFLLFLPKRHVKIFNDAREFNAPSCSAYISQNIFVPK